MNLKEAILFAQKKFKDTGITSASLDAEVLLLEIFNKNTKKTRDKSWLYLNFERYVLSAAEEKKFKQFVRRREKNEPIAYIIEKKEFYGSDFFVDKSVLIPRAETEIIVEKAIKFLEGSERGFTLLDVGTGSGCIIISVLDGLKRIKKSEKIERAFANDISMKALKIAEINAQRHKLKSKIIFLGCDLEDAIERVKDYKNIIITANLPYITPEDYERLKPNVKDFEPKIALTTKEKGLYHINRLITRFAAMSQNFDSYHLLLEAEPQQIRAIEKISRAAMKESKTEIIKDIRGKKRVVVICKT
ncbi:MAG: peptide chain release factor N(5)-glutamine methyltransferase [Candidatus Pacebacteria bacterium]|nr:peptide chain release factor N(5)-glutamine methyltransferase [Candidatus Paceibacterota bacterium]